MNQSVSAVYEDLGNTIRYIFGGKTTPPPVAPIVYQFSSVVSSQAYASEIRRGNPVGTVSSTGNYADARNTQAHQRLFDQGPTYFERVWRNYKDSHTLGSVLVKQGVAAMTMGTIAKELGGLTWKQSKQIIKDRPQLKPNARLAFGLTWMSNALIVTGAFEVGVGIGSMVKGDATL